LDNLPPVATPGHPGLRHTAENTSFQKNLMDYIISKKLDLSSRLQYIPMR
jgi:hypothetical protein